MAEPTEFNACLDDPPSNGCSSVDTNQHADHCFTPGVFPGINNLLGLFECRSEFEYWVRGRSRWIRQDGRATVILEKGENMLLLRHVGNVATEYVGKYIEELAREKAKVDGVAARVEVHLKYAL